MAITYNMAKKGDTLIVETEGFDESLEEVIAYNNAVKEKAEALNCTNILCDERELEYRLSIADTYQLGEHLSHLHIFGKIAIITGEENKDAAQFWEDVASNRGALVRVFYDEAAATAWVSS
jgi:hypothetical protein